MKKKERVTLAAGERSYTVRDAIAVTPVPMSFPTRELPIELDIVTGFRMDCLTVTDAADEEVLGRVQTGGGSEWVHLEWRGHRRSLRFSEMLRTLIAEVAPEDLHLFEDI